MNYADYQIPTLDSSHPPTRSLIQTCGGRSAVTCRSGGPSAGPSAKPGTTSITIGIQCWKGFQRPKRLEFERETLTDRFGRFYAQPFERGFGTTIGNALRRVLLSSIEGAAITAVKIDGVLHEFSPIPGVVEDATDIILNLKQIPLKLHVDQTKTLTLRDRQGRRSARRATSRPTATSRSSSRTPTSRPSPTTASSTWRCA